MNRTAVLAALLAALPFVAACQDPCVALAERICNCEPSPFDRLNCRADRITGQQAQVELEESDRQFCSAALETCNCAALDENQLDACGFVPSAEGT